MTLEPEHILVIAMFVSFVVLLFTGFPVAWVLAGVGVAFAGIGWLTDNVWETTVTGLGYDTLGLAVGRIFSIMDNWVLVALPMFIFMGLMLDKSGVAERMLHSMQRLFGRTHGGLAITVTLIGIILAASTGIIGASVVLLGTMALPLMLRQRYHAPLALGTVASAGSLGILIPPSIMLVIMGDQLGVPVGDLFMAAVFPGLILGLLYIGYIVLYGRLRPERAPPADLGAAGWRDAARLLLDVLPPALLILAVLGSIFMGIATVTEASGIGALGAALLALGYRRLDFPVLREVVIKTMNTSAYIFAIFIGATVFSLVLRELGGDELIESALTGLGLGPYELIALVLLLVFVLGFFLDWIEISLIILPLLAPVVTALGLDIDGHGVVDNPELVWFALLVAVALQTSFLTPPVGFAIFYLKGVCPEGVRLQDIYRGVTPFILLQLIGLALVFAFPQLAVWLPSVAYG